MEGVNNDVIISCYVNPSQLFLQQPMHPTYPSLHILHTLMGVCYQDPKVPKLPSIVTGDLFEFDLFLYFKSFFGKFCCIFF